MIGLIFAVTFAVAVAIRPEYNRRHLIPKTLAQKLCEEDSSLTICSLPEVTPPRNPVTVWGICDDHPHLMLCRFRPPAAFPKLEIVQATTEEPDEFTEVVVVEELPLADGAAANIRYTLMEKVVNDILKEKDRRLQKETDDSFDDSIMMNKGNIFDDIRLI